VGDVEQDPAKAMHGTHLDGSETNAARIERAPFQLPPRRRHNMRLQA